MKADTFAYYLLTLHRFTDIPIVYKSTDGSMRRFQPFILDGDENSLDFIASRLESAIAADMSKNAMYLIHPSMVMLGIAVNRESNSFVFIGPVALAAAKAEDIDDYLFEAGLPPSATKKLSTYLHSASIHSADMFKQILVNINAALNDEILSTEELTVLFDTKTEDKLEYERLQLQDEGNHTREGSGVSTELTQRLNYCVMHGDLIGLSENISNLNTYEYFDTGKKSLREEKLTAFGSVYALETVALRSGISGNDLQAVKKYYLTSIDEAPNEDIIRQLVFDAMYDFTRRVKDYLRDDTDDPTINRVIAYIKDNINYKLQSDDITAALRVNKHYLFTKFKSATGQTLTEFINKEKIKKACYYMSITDKSISEIADHLSFSSQSYFQSVFKKVTGKTPKQWRSENEILR